jgi:hypothetical protein
MPICPVYPDSSGGVTPAPTIVSDGKLKLLAAIDFSTCSPATLTDGDYVMATTPASSVASVTVTSKNMASNPSGSFAITGGKLVINVPSGSTSTFGQFYWSTTHSPFLSIDMRQFAEVLADVNLQKWDLVMDVDHEQFYTGPTAIPTNPGNYEINTGFTCNMSAYLANGTIPPKWWYSRLRSDAAAGYPAPDGTYYWGKNGKTTTTDQAGEQNYTFKTNSAPMSSLYTTGPTKTRTLWDTSFCGVTYFTPTLVDGYRYYYSASVNGTNQDWNSVGNAWRPGQTNDVAATISAMRTGGSGASSFKILKISLYLRERS